MCNFSTMPVLRDIIETCICMLDDGIAPNCANHQLGHFTIVDNLVIKHQICSAAKLEERAFY